MIHVLLMILFFWRMVICLIVFGLGLGKGFLLKHWEFVLSLLQYILYF